jgi:hypothetical protein
MDINEVARRVEKNRVLAWLRGEQRQAPTEHQREANRRCFALFALMRQQRRRVA